MSRETTLLNTIRKCRKGSRRAQFDLYKLCFDFLMITCNRFTNSREDALALLNQGFLKILTKLDSYDDEKDFFPWISTIMVRTAIDEYRSKKTYKSETVFYESDSDLDDLYVLDSTLEVVEQMSADEIKKLIFELPENERLVFTLYEMEGFKHHEIAAQMGVSERTTKRYLKSAKYMLQKRLGAYTEVKSMTS